jgi:hypothetical protein
MSSDDSVYRAPASALDRPTEGSARTLEDAIAGNFDFEMGEVFSEDWALVNGSKMVVCAGAALSLGANVIAEVLAWNDGSGISAIVVTVVWLAGKAALYAINATINAGLFLYAIKRAAGDDSASFADITSCFQLILPIAGLTLLPTLLMLLGFALFLIPGIYLAVAYVFAVPLKVERGLGIWDSLETSRKSVTNAWWKVAGVMLGAGLAVIIGTIVTLGIGIIWLGPFMIMVMGVTYREIFGYSASAR